MAQEESTDLLTAFTENFTEFANATFENVTEVANATIENITEAALLTTTETLTTMSSVVENFTEKAIMMTTETPLATAVMETTAAVMETTAAVMETTAAVMETTTASVVAVAAAVMETTTVSVAVAAAIMETTTASTVAANVTTIAAEHEMTLEDLRMSMDTFFLIINSMLIFFLQGGFAFLEAGSVRSKNTTNILIKNLLDILLACAAFWIFGYMFAYSDGNTFIGTDLG
jgi:hypothetical protein